MADLNFFSGVYSEEEISVAAVSSFISNLAVNSNPEGLSLPEFHARMTTPQVLLPFIAVGSGWGVDSSDVGVHALLVVLHESPELAEANQERLTE
jgi:hypothetical protein